METPSGSTETRADATQAVTRTLSPGQVNAIAQGVRLNLPPERVEALARSLSDFLTGFATIRAIDTGDREPVTLTHAEEGNA